MKKNLGFIILWIAWLAMACFLYSVQVQNKQLATNLGQLSGSIAMMDKQFMEDFQTAVKLSKGHTGEAEIQNKIIANHEKRIQTLEGWYKMCQ